MAPRSGPKIDPKINLKWDPFIASKSSQNVYIYKFLSPPRKPGLAWNGKLVHDGASGATWFWCLSGTSSWSTWCLGWSVERHTQKLSRVLLFLQLSCSCLSGTSPWITGELAAPGSRVALARALRALAGRLKVGACRLRAFAAVVCCAVLCHSCAVLCCTSKK